MERKASKETLERAKEEQYVYLYRKCLSSLFGANEHFALGQYSDSICLFYDVFEFFWKCLRHLACHDVQALRQHLPTQDMWDSFMPRLAGLVISEEECRKSLEMFRVCNPRWEDNPQERLNARYGGGSFDKQQVRRMMVMAESLASTLAKAQRRLSYQQDVLDIAVLNGYFGRGVGAEKVCDQAPWADHEQAGVEGWRKALSERLGSKAAISKIGVTRMNNRYLAVINPFGETYPELPSTAGVLPGYQMIRDYVYSGGAFVTAGGHPFAYLFDVMRGIREDTSTFIRDIPVSIRLIPAQDGRIKVDMVGTTVVLKTLLRQEFGVETTWDEPTKNQQGPALCEIFQKQEDKEYWDFAIEGLSLHEYRSFDPASGGYPIPVLRAKRLTKEVYPIAFVRYGFGLLLHIGLALNREKTTEFNIAVNAVSKGLLENFNKYFPD